MDNLRVIHGLRRVKQELVLRSPNRPLSPQVPAADGCGRGRPEDGGRRSAVGLLGLLVHLLAQLQRRRDGADAALPAQLVPAHAGTTARSARARLHGPRGVSRSHIGASAPEPRGDTRPCRPQL